VKRIPDTIFIVKQKIGKMVQIFRTSDNYELHYRKFVNNNRKAIVFLHGIESHSGWFTDIAQQLLNKNIDCYCIDRRGSGLNKEQRGHIADYQILIEDVEEFITSIKAKYNKIFILGLSWGGKLAVCFTLKYPNLVNGIVLISPGLFPKIRSSFITKTRIFIDSILHKEKGRRF